MSGGREGGREGGKRLAGSYLELSVFVTPKGSINISLEPLRNFCEQERGFNLEFPWKHNTAKLTQHEFPVVHVITHSSTEWITAADHS